MKVGEEMLIEYSITFLVIWMGWENIVYKEKKDTGKSVGRNSWEIENKWIIFTYILLISNDNVGRRKL